MSVHLSREKALLGTADGVKRLAKNFDVTFVVVSGDALTDIDIGELVAFHKGKGALATIALRRVERTSKFGVVEIDADGDILRFQEKPAPGEAVSSLANTGVFVLEPEALDYVPEHAFSDFAQDVFPRFLEDGERFCGYEGDFYWSDIGTLSAYRSAQRNVLSGRVDVVISGEHRNEDLWVDRNARLHPTAFCEGPTFIESEAIVGAEVTLAGEVVVAGECWIRPKATIKQSVLLAGVHVVAGAYVEDCIVEPGYHVRPGETIRGSVLMNCPEVAAPHDREHYRACLEIRQVADARDSMVI